MEVQSKTARVAGISLFFSALILALTALGLGILHPKWGTTPYYVIQTGIAASLLATAFSTTLGVRGLGWHLGEYCALGAVISAIGLGLYSLIKAYELFVTPSDPVGSDLDLIRATAGLCILVGCSAVAAGCWQGNAFSRWWAIPFASATLCCGIVARTTSRMVVGIAWSLIIAVLLFAVAFAVLELTDGNRWFERLNTPAAA